MSKVEFHFCKYFLSPCSVLGSKLSLTQLTVYEEADVFVRGLRPGSLQSHTVRVWGVGHTYISCVGKAD